MTTADPPPCGTMTCMTFRRPSWAVTRNTALRTLVDTLRAAYPDVTFDVWRHGLQIDVEWDDGPTSAAVHDMLRAARPRNRLRNTGVHPIRTMSHELHAVAYLRAYAAGEDTWSQKAHAQNAEPGGATSLARTLDAATITGAEWAAGRLVTALVPATGRAFHWTAVAKAVHDHGHILDTVLAETTLRARP